MLHIILMILKILGILILSILSFGLCIGLLVLFCPIRYYLEGSIYGKPKGHIRVSWLLRLVCVTFSYQENQFSYKFCILGIPLKKRKKKELPIVQETQGKKEKKRILFFKRKREKQAAEEKKEKLSQSLKEIEELQESEKILQEAEEKETGVETEKIQQKNNIIIKENTEKEKEVPFSPIEKTQIQQEISEKEEETTQGMDIEELILQLETEKKEDRLPLLEKMISWIRIILVKIKGIPIKVKGIIVKIKETLFAIKRGIQKFLALLKEFNKKKQAVLAFIKEEKNKEAFRYTRVKFFQLLCHILPGKVTLRLHYGFEDPATTGILTGIIFMLYPKSAKEFQLMPDFENRVLEGELTIKGRVRLVKVLWTLLSIYFHKECNRIIKMIIKR